MKPDPSQFSRRFVLQALASLAAAAGLPVLDAQPAEAAIPELPPNFGRGRSVAVIGAGVAGITAGWILARGGFKVTIYEADSRYGGRSLTVRPVRKDYSDWWFSKYDARRLFPKMYVSRYQESSASPDPQPQICGFDDPHWDPHSGEPPLELFLNAGPGRIPSDHRSIIEICRRTEVALEPYIFLSNYNLLQSDTFNHGKPIAFNQVNYSLRGEVAAMLAQAIQDGHMLGKSSPDYQKKMLQMLKQFGDLTDDYKYNATSRLGYSHLPGGWRDAGVVNPKVPLPAILDSQFVGGGNPETNPGSFLFNSDSILWQASLLQPVGGMDRIWQQLLLQEIPSGAVELRTDDPRAAGLAARDRQGRGIKRYVGDLILLNHHTTRIAGRPQDSKIHVDYDWNDPEAGRSGHGAVAADFCFSTMAPGLLARVAPDLPQEFREALARVTQVPAIKVGWQGRSRFWETEDNIYGGISWTTDIIGQIWYPSEDFGTSTGVLTGAYNRGPAAAEFGRLKQADRLARALAGGQKLHPNFRAKVYADKGVTIAWHQMPYQQGGWADYSKAPDVYHTITNLPQGRLYLVGDAWSHLPGWMEGSVTSVSEGIRALQKHGAMAAQPAH